MSHELHLSKLIKKINFLLFSFPSSPIPCGGELTEWTASGAPAGSRCSAEAGEECCSSLGTVHPSWGHPGACSDLHRICCFGWHSRQAVGLTWKRPHSLALACLKTKLFVLGQLTCLSCQVLMDLPAAHMCSNMFGGTCICTVVCSALHSRANSSFCTEGLVWTLVSRCSATQLTPHAPPQGDLEPGTIPGSVRSRLMSVGHATFRQDLKPTLYLQHASPTAECLTQTFLYPTITLSDDINFSAQSSQYFLNPHLL